MINISERQIHSYQEDGVVCLRKVFDDHWIELVRKGIAAAIKTPGPSGENYNPDGPAFFVDLDMWQRHDEWSGQGLISSRLESLNIPIFVM